MNVVKLTKKICAKNGIERMEASKYVKVVQNERTGKWEVVMV